MHTGMKRIDPVIIALIIGTASLSCCSVSKPSDISLNRSFAEYYFKHVNKEDLYPLTSEHRCELDEIIREELDLINDYKYTVLHDTFLIRNYGESFYSLPFSFVKDNSNGEIYFISLPTLYSYILYFDQQYSRTNDSSKYVLSSPREITKLSTPLLDHFFAATNFKVLSKKGFFRKKILAQHIMEALLPRLYEDFVIPSNQLLIELDEEVDNNSLSLVEYNKMQVLVKDNGIDEVQIFKLPPGFLVLKYIYNKNDSRLELHSYFLPEYLSNHRSGIVGTIETGCK
jgi:hypothetical protein